MTPGATEQQREVVTAVLADARVADIFAQMLKEVGNDPTALARYSRTSLENGSATLPDAPIPTVGRIETVKRYQSEETCTAVAGTVTVKGKQFDTLLSEGSFNLSRADQTAYAKSLGFRFATREEHRVYVDSLLAKEDAGTINEAEKNALETYRKRYVRDDQGGLVVDGRGVYAYDPHWYDDDYPNRGALFVRLSAESN